ncbi:MAG: hypothetical protein PHV33_00005, partial [Elusimicrobiales bacterium]|nr:hypothetical protein [Elusimicrobiales bacterium]
YPSADIRTNLGLGALATAASVSGGAGGTITDDSVIDADIKSNAAIAISKLATTGTLGADVLVSSVAIAAFYPSADIRTNLGLGALATKATVATADIDALAVTDAKINDVAGSKITGAGSIVADRIASGALGTSVIVSSIAVQSVNTADQIAAATINNEHVADVGMSKLTQVPLVTAAAAYTLTSTDTVVFAGAAITITLPAVSASTVGKEYYLYNTGAATNVTVAPATGEFLNGVADATKATTAQWQFIKVIGFDDGTNNGWVATVVGP